MDKRLSIFYNKINFQNKMKKILQILLLLGAINGSISTFAAAQTLLYIANGATVYAKSATTTTALQVNGAILNNGQLIDAGRIVSTGSLQNNNSLIGNGILSVAGNIANGSAASLSPGISDVGMMTLIGDYTMGSSALNIELGGAASTADYDNLAVTGAATLTGGTLNVSLVGGYTPVGGESFSVLSATNLVGAFATLNLPTLSGSLTWATEYNTSTGIFKLSISSPLPVKLLSFQAAREKSAVRLDWFTATEINTHHFDIERSADGLHFEKIAQVSAKGSNSNYTNWDNQPLQHSNYYRLKMTDIDGRFEYSPVVSVKMPEENAIRIYPNPSTSAVYIQTADRAQATALIDAKGTLISSFSTVPEQLDVADLPAGFYTLTIGLQTMKIVKQ
jgi:hypothetical protein